LISYFAQRKDPLALAFQSPALRKEREERGIHFIADASEIKAWATRQRVAAAIRQIDGKRL